jgi:group I intron endonuclease
MGAVFAMFAGWYFWVPKLLGLNYNILLSKVQFWLLFIGVEKNGRLFEKGKRLFSSYFLFIFSYIKQSYIFNIKQQKINKKLGKGGSPLNPEEFILFFDNVKENKKNIYTELRNKAGIYVFINNETNQLYVGSSINLTKRMVNYFYYYNSDKPSQLVIIKAMKKYGLDNFSLGIKEFCDKNPKICIDLEQKGIDYYKPKYNVLTTAGNSFGYKHKIDTINKLKEILSKENHPKYGSITSVETKQAISKGIKLYYSNHNHPSKGLKGKLSPQYGIGGKLVFCYNKTDKEFIFPSINAAKQYFKVRWSFIKNNLDTKKWIILQDEEWLIQSIPKQKE